MSENNTTTTKLEAYGLPFTEEELKQLNFTQEELDILEAASAYSAYVDELPESPDGMVAKLDEYFAGSENSDPGETIEKLGRLCETDPEFITQLVIAQEVLAELRSEQDVED